MKSNKMLIMVILIIIPITYILALPSVQLHVPPIGQYGIEQLWKATIINPDTQTYMVWLEGQIFKDGQEKFWAQSDSFALPPGTKEVGYRDIRVLHTRTATGYEQIAERTGGLPEGDYTFTITLMPQQVSNTININVQLPGAPQLISPADGEKVNIMQPTFTWTPPQPSPTGQVTYEIKIVEKLSSQTPLQAMQANPVWFQKRDINSTSLTYPLSAQKLDTTKTYAWQVTAFSGRTEIGKSEIFVFSTKEEPSLTVYSFKADCATGVGCYNFVMEIQYSGTDAPPTQFTMLGFSEPSSSPLADNVIGSITAITPISITCSPPLSLNLSIPASGQPSGSDLFDLTSCGIIMNNNTKVTITGNLCFYSAGLPVPVDYIKVWLYNETGTHQYFGSNGVTFQTCGYNCCKDFNKKVYNLTVTESGTNKYTLSGTLTAGPEPICKIQARIVNFSYKPVSIPPSRNCSMCVWPSRKFGNFGPPVSLGTLTPAPALTTLSPFNYSREFIWTGTPINISNTPLPFTVGLLVPDASPFVNCCGDMVKMTIRFLFTDTTCLTCDTVISFWFTRNPFSFQVGYIDDSGKDSNIGYGFNSHSVMQTGLAMDNAQVKTAKISYYQTNSLDMPAGHGNSRLGRIFYFLLVLLPLTIGKLKRKFRIKNIKLFIFLLSFLVCFSSELSAVCCPEFTLVADFQPCDSCETTGMSQVDENDIIVACKNIKHTYYIYPNLPNFTYDWIVSNGTSTSYTGNPLEITWGNSSPGFIQVKISDTILRCYDSITKTVCLIDGPIASFTFVPNPVCLAPSVVEFANTSVGGSSYYWDFGDGSFSDLQNPTHSYTTSGPHTVTLTVSADKTAWFDTIQRNCKCRDVATAEITVDSQAGIDISADCRKMLCNGDTVKYCTSTSGCTGLSWTVNGGSIQGDNTTTCITVVWDQPSTYPTTVTLTADCPDNICGNSATIFVPVLYPDLPIQAPTHPPCVDDIATYSLPAMPGTFYHWSVSGGGYINAADSNINFINVIWTGVGDHTITCDYNNPYSGKDGCEGKSELTVSVKDKFTISGSSSACTEADRIYAVVNGGNANWTITPTTGHTPSGPISGSFINLTWTEAGTYCITAVPTDINAYCTQSASIIVTVNPNPVLSVITGDAQVCPGQYYNYSVDSDVSGGDYIWTVNPSVTTPPVLYGENHKYASIMFDGNGPWILKVQQDVNGCIGIAELTIEKEPELPEITVTPNDNVCSGGTITASVTGSVPPSGYTWSCTPGAVLTDGQGTTTAIFIVNDDATIILGSCGESKTRDVFVKKATVQLNQTPGPCKSTITATPNINIGTCNWSYTWYLNGELKTDYSGNEITVYQNGNYTVLVECEDGGCKATASIVITDITPVSVNITATGNLCNNGSVTLTASIFANCPGASFTWSNGATGNPITVNSPGTYNVTVNCSNGCSATSNSIRVADCSAVPASCINDLEISPSNCPNPVQLTILNIPIGCTPTSTTWFYGDGHSNTTGEHQYADPGHYTVFALMECSDGTKHCGTQDIIIPLVDSFTRVIGCGSDCSNEWKIYLKDASKYLPAWAGYTIDWFTTCGDIPPTDIHEPDPILTVPFGCNPTVTLTISKNGCTLSKSYTFDLPTTQLEINGSAIVCKGVNNEFSSSFTDGLTYDWDFGDYTKGVTNPIKHAYDGTNTNPITINLKITDTRGCVFCVSKPITVITSTITITNASPVQICPDCLPPKSLETETDPTTGFDGYQWYHNGVASIGATNSTYELCDFDATGNYYVTANDNNGCIATSNTVQVLYYPKPVADIQGQSIQCAGDIVPYNIELRSPNISGYVYNWECRDLDLNIPLGVEFFIPNNRTDHITFMAPDKHSYQFILTVTDNNGCMAKDTFCVIVYSSPTVNIDAPSFMCEGTMYTLTATPYNPNYIYHWNNGAIGEEITTGQVGEYFVTVTDRVSGCSNNSPSVIIRRRPYVDLFPVGCDTICYTDTIIPPLPLAPGQTYNGTYDIQWYVDNVLFPTSPKSELTGLSLGPHQIYIVVTDNLTHCTSTSGIYDVFVKCCCNENNHWENITCSSSSQQSFQMDCDKSYDLKCNETYTINAGYHCEGSTECDTVTYAITDPAGNTTTNNVPFTFTPTLNGNYLLTLYGWCGDELCDSCKITFKVVCEGTPGGCAHCCDNFVINIQSETIHYGTEWWNWYVKSKLTTSPNYIIEIRAELVNFYMNDKTGCERCVNQNAYLGSIIPCNVPLSQINWPPLISPAPRPYSNASPRELVWNRIVGGFYQARPPFNNEDVSLRIVFSPPHIFQNSCCFDTIRFCIRWSFTDITCTTCDTLICYKIIQQYNEGGGNERRPDGELQIPDTRQGLLNDLPNSENSNRIVDLQKPNNTNVADKNKTIETTPTKGCGCNKK